MRTTISTPNLEDSPVDGDLMELVIDVQTCRPEFVGLNEMALQNTLREVPLEAAVGTLKTVDAKYYDLAKIFFG